MVRCELDGDTPASLFLLLYGFTPEFLNILVNRPVPIVLGDGEMQDDWVSRR